MEFKNILTEIQDNILTLTINRPSKMNALNKETLSEIRNAIQAAIENTEVYGIILTGSGDKAFVAGADIAEFANFTKSQGVQMAQNGHEIFNLIEQSPKPVLAAINGFALGGGCELAMACHMRIASDNARFGQPEINLGIIPGYGGTQRLIQNIGKSKALELLLTGDMIDASTALNLGLVNHVTSSEDLIASGRKLLGKIILKGPTAIKRILDLANAFYNKHENGFVLEIKQFGDCFETEEFREGTQAFLNKEKPDFRKKASTLN